MEISFIYTQILVHLHVKQMKGFELFTAGYHSVAPTRTHFQTEAKGNSEIAYLTTQSCADLKRRT